MSADPPRLTVAAVQAAPRPLADPLAGFEREVLEAQRCAPDADLVLFPELHLFGDDLPDDERNAVLDASAQALDGPLVTSLRELAGDTRTWLIPGTVCERGPRGELFNTAPVLSPRGELVTWYRKVFPWRPFEPYDPGDRFVTFDVPRRGRVGVSICYDAWFPEVARHLAWMGADVVVNLVKTTTPDREQELVLARASAITNQTYVVSLNCAGPVGRGRSLIVDPEGRTIDERPDASPSVLTARLDLSAVDDARTRGTSGTNRMWSQMRPSDPPIPLPLYGGAMDAARWSRPAHRRRRG